MSSRDHHKKKEDEWSNSEKRAEERKEESSSHRHSSSYRMSGEKERGEVASASAVGGKDESSSRRRRSRSRERDHGHSDRDRDRRRERSRSRDKSKERSRSRERERSRRHRRRRSYSSDSSRSASSNSSEDSRRSSSRDRERRKRDRKRDRRSKSRSRSRDRKDRKDKKERRERSRSRSRHRDRDREKDRHREKEKGPSSSTAAAASSSSSAAAAAAASAGGAAPAASKRLSKKEREAAEKEHSARIAEIFGYTAENNPFGDTNLTQAFVWGKKIAKEIESGKRDREPTMEEQRRAQEDHLKEVELARQRRIAREKEQEEMERLRAEEARLKGDSEYAGWEQKEEVFLQKQVRERCLLRIRDGREKPVDAVAKNALIADLIAAEQADAAEEAKLAARLRAAQEEADRIGNEGPVAGVRAAMANMRRQADKTLSEILHTGGGTATLISSVQLEEPYLLFEGLTVEQLQEMGEDLWQLLTVEGSSGQRTAFWKALLAVCDDELRRAEARERGLSEGRSLSSLQLLEREVDAMFLGKSEQELEQMAGDIKARMRGRGGGGEGLPGEPPSSFSSFSFSSSSSSSSQQHPVVDAEYWEGILKHLKVAQAKASLLRMHEELLLLRLDQIEQAKGEAEELAGEGGRAGTRKAVARSDGLGGAPSEGYSMLAGVEKGGAAGLAGAGAAGAAAVKKSRKQLEEERSYVPKTFLPQTAAAAAPAAAAAASVDAASAGAETAVSAGSAMQQEGEVGGEAAHAQKQQEQQQQQQDMMQQEEEEESDIGFPSIISSSSATAAAEYDPSAPSAASITSPEALAAAVSAADNEDRQSQLERRLASLRARGLLPAAPGSAAAAGGAAAAAGAGGEGAPSWLRAAGGAAAAAGEAGEEAFVISDSGKALPTAISEADAGGEMEVVVAPRYTSAAAAAAAKAAASINADLGGPRGGSSSARGGAGGAAGAGSSSMSGGLLSAHEEYLLQDRFRPRKPRYFNRVKTGYDWNKYNQTHYTVDNPPPKTVQGYKFNVFYPDLIDKSRTPSFFLSPADSDEYCIIHFRAGPPYEDVAFKIVNKEWEYQKKHGFRCLFDRGVLQLHFNFKRSRYRK